MKKSAYFIVATAMLLMLTSCASRTDTSSPSSSKESSSSTSSSSASSSVPSSSSSSSSEEAKDQIAAHEGQADPTLPENMEASSPIWRHTEYKAWGDVSAYKLNTVSMDEAGRETAPKIKYTILLPETLSPASVLDYDGGFANGKLKVGSQPVQYYKLMDGETITDNSYLPSSFFQSHPMTGERYTVVETADNVVGGFYKTDKFCRYIGRMDGDDILAEYVIDLGDNAITYAYFYISNKATAEELKIYDAIVNSITLIDKISNSAEEVKTVEDVAVEDKFTFVGTISSISGNTALVLIDKGYEIGESSANVNLATSKSEVAFAVGDRIKVEYNGTVNETFPIQLDATKVTLVK